MLGTVRSGTALLVLLAPDTEESEALDGKVDSLVAEASARTVPTLYCLSRRRMGKACRAKTRQSAVAIVSLASTATLINEQQKQGGGGGGGGGVENDEKEVILVRRRELFQKITFFVCNR